MKEFVRGVTEQVTNTAPEGKLDFAGVLKVTQRIGDDYVKWQGRDCARAKRELAAMPSLTNGRVPVSSLAPSHADSYRPLFTEKIEDLKKYGVLDQPNESLNQDEQGHLIVANYINSQAMCLNTANYYTACCTNDCEDLMLQLERTASEPTLTPEKVSETMASLPGVVLGKEQLLGGARAIAATNGGRVPLYGREFAALMHQSFPLECPSPSDQKTTNPKTPDEWMAESNDDVQDTDDMMREIADVLAHYTSMSIASEPEHAEDEKQSGKDVIKLVDKTHIAAAANAQAFSILIYIIMLASMLGLVATIIKSGLVASGLSPDKISDEGSFEIACLA